MFISESGSCSVATQAPEAAAPVTTDTELLAEYVRTRSAEAFTAIVERHSAAVYSTCFAILRDRHLAEDAAQSVFLVLVRKAAGLSRDVVLPGWLNICARACARELQRREQRRARRERESLDRRVQVQTQTQEDERRAQLLSLVDSVLASLPSMQRDAILLRYCYGYSETLAAREMGCAEHALHARVTRGLAQLRERLRRRGAVLPLAAILPLLTPDRTAGSLPASTSLTAASVANKVSSAGALMTLKSAIAAAVAMVMFCGAAWTFTPRRVETPAAPTITVQHKTVATPIKAARVVADDDGQRLDDRTVWQPFGELDVRTTATELSIPLEHHANGWAVGGLMNRKMWDLSECTLTISARIHADSSQPAEASFFGLVIDDDANFESVLHNAAACEDTFVPDAHRSHATAGETSEYVISKDGVELRVDGKIVSQTPWPRPITRIYVGLHAGSRGSSLATCRLTDVSVRVQELGEPQRTF
jgi:RNA polymerase sigma factor (sigma-70 family)